MKGNQKYCLILLAILLFFVVLCLLVLKPVGEGNTGSNLLYRSQINKMAQHLNDKYGYSLNTDDCIYFRKEDYSWHGDMFGFGKTYNIPHIAAFEVDGKQIVVADRKGVISDNGQQDELNDLVCGYFADITGLDIEYVEIRKASNGNYVDRALNHILQYSFQERITQENIADFMECVWAVEDLELIFYFVEAEDPETQLEAITTKLKTIGLDRENLVLFKFLIRKADEPLNLMYAEPDLNTDYLDHNVSSDHSDEYKFGCYYIYVEYFKLHHYYEYGGTYNLGKGYTSGFGSRYEHKYINDWKVTFFNIQKESAN